MPYYYRARYYDPTSGRFISEDAIRFRGGANFYAYVANEPTQFFDAFGLQHSPGGPWHPEGWIEYGCTWADDCSTLSWKIDLFKKIIAEHIAWDKANNTTTHTDNQDIPNHINGLNNCIKIHQAKCTNNCPKFQPFSEPVPIPAPPKTPPGTNETMTLGTVLLGLLGILYTLASQLN